MTAAALTRTGTELRRAVTEARHAWNGEAWLAAGGVALAALVPFMSLPGVRLDALADTVYLAVAATALGLTVGAAGLPSLGAGAFMAIGAFTAALLVARSGWPVEPAALCGTAAALTAALICGIVVRLRPVFVAVSTWLLAWLVWIFLLAFPSVSGGSQGLILPQRTLLGLVPTPTVHYEIALALLVLTATGIAAVRRGAPGLELSALRQAPPLATSLGVPLARRRLGAFALSAALAGLAGALSVQLAAVADPAGYDPFLGSDFDGVPILPQEIDSAHIRHSHVGYDASQRFVRQCVEKCFGRIETLYLKLCRTQQECQRFAKRFIIVNDMHDSLCCRLFRRHRRPPCSQPAA